MFEVFDYYSSDGPMKYDGGVIQYGFGVDEKVDSSVYSDRLYGWDSKKYNKVCREVWGNEGQYFYPDRQPEDIEKFLRIILNNENIVLKRVLRFENACNGFPYWRFDYSLKTN